MTSPHLKKLKCSTCPEILEVDRSSIACQCHTCIMAMRPAPRQEEPDPAQQLELGEVAS